MYLRDTCAPQGEQGVRVLPAWIVCTCVGLVVTRRVCGCM